MDEVLSYWLDIMQSIVHSLFSYQIVSGVSFGAFLVAVCCMSILIHFVFLKMVK